MSWLKSAWERHSLGIVVTAVWITLVLLSMWRFDGSWGEWFSERAGGHSDDAFGAWLIIMLTKRLREHLSAASN